MNISSDSIRHNGRKKPAYDAGLINEERKGNRNLIRQNWRIKKRITLVRIYFL